MPKSSFHKQRRCRKAFRRLLRIVACAALFIPAAESPAQRVAGARMLPAPGSIGTSLRLRRVITGPVSPATNDHPLFHSSYMGEPDRIVARTKYGNVTARDLYLWLIMREGPHRAFILESFDKARTQSDKDAIARYVRDEIDEYVFTNFVIPKIMGNTPCDGVAAIKEQLYTLPIYQLAYIKHVIEPSLAVLPADRVKYLQEHKAEITEPDRWRTRYIFMASNEDDLLEEQDAVLEQMETLRSQVIAGEVSFPEAARAHSQAVSASRGGEIPPFRTGELFFFYEDNARALQPGEVSPVFRGPRGLYMVQLIEALPGEEPNLDDPQQAMKVDEALTRQILREAYDWDLRSMIIRERQPIFRYRNWDLLEDCDPVGEVCGFELTKQNIREAFPEIETDDLRFRPALVETWVRTIVEREAMAQEVRGLGLDQDEMVQRGRWMAANIVRRDGFVDRLRCGLDVNEEKVRQFWVENPRLFTPLAMKRLIRVTLTALNSAPLPEQIGSELERVLVDAGGGAPTVPVKAGQEIAYQERSETVVRDTLLQTEEVFRALEDDTPETTSTLESSMPAHPDEPEIVMDLSDGPTTTTVMIPGLAPLPAPDFVTTKSLVELRGGGTSEPPAGGGCVPLKVNVVPPPFDNDPLPGLVDEEEIPEVIPPRLPAVRPAGAVAKVYSPAGSLEPVAPDHPNWRSATVLPPAGPAPAQPLPQGIVAPAIGPQLDLQRAPNENKQLTPPPTSNYAYNPDWFFARIDLTVIRDLVKSYLSSDYVLKYDDLNYVYVEDVPGAPARVETVPVGAFSRPVLVGNSAVAYYVEDARQVEKPPFESIKTQVYGSYTQVKVDQALQAAYKAEMGAADVTYTFAETAPKTHVLAETVSTGEK